MAETRFLIPLVTLLGFTTFLVSLTHAATPAPPGVRVFALTFMITNEGSTDAGYSHVAVSSVDNAATRITIPSAGVSEYSLLRQNNDRTKEYVTNTVVLHNTVTEGVSDKGAIVITNGTADVSGSRVILGSGDTFHALPLTVNGRSFFIPSYRSMLTGKSFYGIAAASSTCLEIYSFNDAGAFVLEDSLALAYGEVFQKYSPDNSMDFTGLYITSSAPIAVFSGHECAQIPMGVNYCDHMVDQIPAVQFWGNTTIVPPVPDRLEGAGYTVRIIASQETTIDFPYNKPLVEYQSGCDTACAPGTTAEGCTSPCMITKGRFLEVRATNALMPITVTCSVPCLVVQYGHSLRTVDGEVEPHDPDPFMAVITPTDHYVNKMSYVTPSFADGNNLEPYAHFITFISKVDEVSGLRLDGAPVTIPGVDQGGYKVISQAVSHGTHVIDHADSTKKVMAFPVGHNPATLEATSSSYRFSAGYEIDDMTLPGEWTELIELPAGVIDPDVVTQAPRVCTRSVSSTIANSFVLRGVATEADVTSCHAAMTTTRLNTFAEQINEAICDRLICPDVPDDVYVQSLRSEIVDGALYLTVDLTNSLDATVMAMVECRVHIADYMRRSDFWGQSTLPTDDLSTCDEVIVTLEKIQSTWVCPNPESTVS